MCVCVKKRAYLPRYMFPGLAHCALRPPEVSRRRHRERETETEREREERQRRERERERERERDT